MQKEQHQQVHEMAQSNALVDASTSAPTSAKVGVPTTALP
jgi:hypothetical protein